MRRRTEGGGGGRRGREEEQEEEEEKEEEKKKEEEKGEEEEEEAEGEEAEGEEEEGAEEEIQEHLRRAIDATPARGGKGKDTDRFTTAQSFPLVAAMQKLVHGPLIADRRAMKMTKEGKSREPRSREQRRGTVLG